MTAEPIGDDELAAWLRLTETPGVGPAACRALLGAFGMPQAVLAASREQLVRVVSPLLADALRRPPDAELETLVAATQAWAGQDGNHVVTLADTRYPPLLLETTDPPPVLYVKGRVEWLAAPMLAIVGSRNATAQGAIDARRFAEALTNAGLTIASGLALGIDAAAHEGALAGMAATSAPDASTIAVMGTGADIVYPASHRALAHRIAADGALVSELPLGTTANAHHFPRRNRIIAGLARGVLVIEAAARSGSLITARLASESGRDVFAVPGSIHSPLSKGCHQLIRQGAKLVESVSDILEEWRDVLPRAAPTPARRTAVAADDDAVLTAIGFDPVPVDEVARRCDVTVAAVAVRLVDLELSGRIVRLPGGRVQRLAR